MIDRPSLLSIPFKWGGTSPQTGLDCIGLAAHVRSYFPDVSQFNLDRIAWVYERYPAESDAPPDLIAKIATELGEPREVPSHLDLVLLRSQRGVICLSTYLEDGSIVFIDQSVRIVPFHRVLGMLDLHSIQYPKGLL